MDSLKLFSPEERRHFMKCECGQYFDMRDLKDVMRHLHKANLEQEADYSHSVKVGEPFVYTKKKKNIGLS